MTTIILGLCFYSTQAVKLPRFNSCSRQPRPNDEPPVGLGYDTNGSISILSANCLNQLYPTVFGFRAGGCANNKFFIDPNLCANTQTAWNSATEFYFNYIEACPKDDSLTPSEQAQQIGDHLVNVCQQQLAHYQSLYVQVLGDTNTNWYSETSKNIDLITQYLEGWNKVTGSGLGGLGWLFSSRDDWVEITGDSKQFTESILWYRHNDLNTSTYDWFEGSSFGGWPTPDAKQYDLAVNQCGVIVNLDDFYVSV